MRKPDAASTVITGLDPVIQVSPGIHPDFRRKTNETSALLDRRVKPGGDGKMGAGRETVRTEPDSGASSPALTGKGASDSQGGKYLWFFSE